MLDHEYKRKTQPHLYNRSWPLTITMLVLFLFVVIGIVAIWRYVGHDVYVVVTVLIPAALCALMLLGAAINGRRETIKETVDSLLSLIWWW
jgi:Flp pilus assembly protein TadB